MDTPSSNGAASVGVLWPTTGTAELLLPTYLWFSHVPVWVASVVYLPGKREQ